MKKRVIILGSTGSIGRNCLEVLEGLDDEFEVVGLAAQNSWKLLSQQVRRWGARFAAISDSVHSVDLAKAVHGSTRILDGEDAMVRLIEAVGCDIVVAAVVGSAGLEATHRAVLSGKRVALANKEAMVVAGAILMPLAHRSGAEIIPIDSEHSAIFQALRAGRAEEVARVILTASGGPFRTWTQEQMIKATLEEALNHPTWDMGAKISIDSATMMNKGLEIIEARWLFGLDPARIEVVVHPESIIHSLVEFCDGSFMAQMSLPDMRTPIQYALTYPSRRTRSGPRLDLRALRQMNFEEPDERKFPALRLGRQVAQCGGTSGAVFNAANEVAVELFRNGEIGFTEIVEYTERTLDRHEWLAEPGMDELRAADRWARNEVTRWVNG